jgi:hypothetical protein
MQYAKQHAPVRPDGHVAWHGDDIRNPTVVIDRARGVGTP